MLQIIVYWQPKNQNQERLTSHEQKETLNVVTRVLNLFLGTKCDINLLNLQFGRGFEEDSGAFSAASGGGMGGGGGDDEDWD